MAETDCDSSILVLPWLLFDITSMELISSLNLAAWARWNRLLLL